MGKIEKNLVNPQPIDAPIHFASTTGDFLGFDRGIEEPEPDYHTTT